MGWEKRKNKKYYYHKQRVNGRVTSQYLGREGNARLWAYLRAKEIAARKERLARSHKIRSEIADLERTLTVLDDNVLALTRAVLLASGFHTHKGKWRLKRATKK